jgi:hypothetical protein
MERIEETVGQDPGLDPGKLLNALIRHLRVKNDTALSRRLGFYPTKVCKLRHGRALLNRGLLRHIQEATGLDLGGLHALMMRPGEEKGFDPNKLLNALLERLELPNDVALARAFDVDPSHISRIRHRKVGVGAPLLIRMHELTGLKVRELRALMDDRRRSWR